MRASTHLAFGLLCATGAFALWSRPLHQDLPALGCALLGSLMPDLDSPKSAPGRFLPFLSQPIERRWGHRTVTHSCWPSWVWPWSCCPWGCIAGPGTPLC